MSATTKMICAALIAVLGSSAAVSVSPQSGVAPRATLPTAASTRAGERVFASGIVEPVSEERDISAAVIGRIARVLVNEGDHVFAGQVIAEIENGDRQAELAAAKARLAMREAELSRLIAGARPEERKEAQAALAEAQASLELAKTIVERRQTLMRLGAVSAETADRARTNYAEALARRDLMAERLALVTAPPRAEDVAIAEANVGTARANVHDAEARLDMTLLRSPIDGTVLKRYRLAGEAVSDVPPTLVAKVGDISHLRVRAQIDESDVGKIVLGERVSISADAFGDRRFEGRVTEIGSRLGPKTLRTDRPTDRVDTEILEALVDVEGEPPLPVGLRVDLSFDPQSVISSVPDKDSHVAMAQAGRPPAIAVAEAVLQPPVPETPYPNLSPRASEAAEKGPPLPEISPLASPPVPLPVTSKNSSSPEPVVAATPRPSAMATGSDPLLTPAREDQQTVGAEGNETGHVLKPSASYSLQFASCAAEPCAAETVALLRERGIAAGIVHSRDHGGRVWFTVRVGNFGSAVAAEAAAGALKALPTGVPAALVVHGEGPT